MVMAHEGTLPGVLQLEVPGSTDYLSRLERSSTTSKLDQAHEAQPLQADNSLILSICDTTVSFALASLLVILDKATT